MPQELCEWRRHCEGRTARDRYLYRVRVHCPSTSLGIEGISDWRLGRRSLYPAFMDDRAPQLLLVPCNANDHASREVWIELDDDKKRR